MDKYEHRRQRLIELLAHPSYAGRGAQAKLSKDSGIDASYISRLLYPEGKSGKKRMAEDTVEAFERGCGLPKGWFDLPLGTPLAQDGATFFGEDRRRQKRRHDDIVDSNVESARTVGLLPLISDVQAGNWSEIVDNFQPGDAEDWIPCPFKHGPNAFILRVAGVSMFNPGGEKSYAPGDFIAVDPQVEPLNRRMVVAKIDHEERATFKQLIIEPDGTHLLQALNPAWPNRLMPMPEGSRIVGVVIGKWTPE